MAEDVEIESLDITGKLEKAKKIPYKHLQVINEYIKSGNRGASYSKIYPKAMMSTAYKNGSEIISRYGWVIGALYEKAGVTPEVIARGIKRNIKDKSGKIRNTALKLGMDLLKLSQTTKAIHTKQRTLVIVKDKEKGVFGIKVEQGNAIGGE